MAPRPHPPSTGLLHQAIALLCVSLALSCGPRPSGTDNSPIDASQGPEQVPVAGKESFTLDRGGVRYHLAPKAHYVLRGVVLGTSSYHFDAMHRLSPCDVAACWGTLVKGDQHARLGWSQSNRWYWWQFGNEVLHDNDWVARWSSNTHIIPANQNLERAAKSLRRGEAAALEGDLVSVEWEQGGQRKWWNTSLTREDEGDGSCEILYLERVRQGGKVYE